MADKSDNKDPVQAGVNRVEKMGSAALTYGQYLQLGTLLSSQKTVGKSANLEPVHDEHLFIITHQAFELWFKQLIYEIDSVRQLFMKKVFDEGKMLLVINRLNRVVVILKLLVEQIMILETMTPLDFMDFRKSLEPASGFQSLQFRLLENKLGVREDLRVKYNQQHYKRVFSDQASLRELEESMTEPSLLELVQRWLERTPGLERTEDCDFQFWDAYKQAVEQMLHDEYYLPAELETDPTLKQLKMADYKKQMEAFNSIDNLEIYNSYIEKGERNFSHKSFQGALMIALYRDEPRFSQPFHLLTLLMDLDALLTKWRYNHVLLVQRMLGTKIGTGGSSGYQYLRSTVSDRYKPFVDLFNLSTFLIPRSRIPPLTPKMKRRLCVILGGGAEEYEDQVEYEKVAKMKIKEDAAAERE